MPEIIKYQTEVLKISEDDVKALVSLSNAPPQPEAEKLMSDNKKRQCVYILANPTSLIQSMDQMSVQEKIF